MIDRVEVSRALAKAIAFKNCGQDALAASWAAEVVTLLECAEILAPVWASVSSVSRDQHRSQFRAVGDVVAGTYRVIKT